MHQFLVWLVPTLEKFPKSQKFLLGDRIQSTALDVHERLIEATFNRTRSQVLKQANLGLQKLRLLMRLAFDLRHVDRRRFEFASRQIDEMGRMVVGWMKVSNDGAPKSVRPGSLMSDGRCFFLTSSDAFAIG